MSPSQMQQRQGSVELSRSADPLDHFVKQDRIGTSPSALFCLRHASSGLPSVDGRTLALGACRV
mgnify:CR=1 FL=1